MNALKDIVVCLFLSAVLLQGAFADGSNNPSPTVSKELPMQVELFEIENGVRSEANRLSSSSLRVEYLKSVITNVTEYGTAENFKKASAIRLLGIIGSTNEIDILVANIGFAANSGDFPTVQAVAAIGEPAVDKLLGVVEKSSNRREIYCAVQALKQIKGTGWRKFVQQQRGIMTEEKWKQMLSYAIDW